MDNQILVEKLRREIESGRLVTVSGTGVSVATCANALIDGEPVATWRGLLRHGLAHCQEIGAASSATAEILARQIGSDEIDMLISAAEMISSRLSARSAGVFRGWLKDSLGRLPVREPALVKVIHSIPGILATLNYDELIEGVTGRRSVTWCDAESVQQALRGEISDVVLHLHGAFTVPESVVLGLQSYLTVREHAHTQAVLRLLTIDRTLLFVGCGDTFFDPNFACLIEWGATALKDVAPRHYLLCREQELPALQQRLIVAPWLQLVPYGKEYSHLESFLQGLLPKAPVLSSKASANPLTIDLEAYKRAMRKHYGRLKLEEVDATADDMQSLSLTGHYVPQSVREWRLTIRGESLEAYGGQHPNLGEGPERHSEDWLVDESLLESTSLPEVLRLVTEIAADPQLDHLVILGDPGSGKSTLLQYLMLAWAEATTSSDKLVLLIEVEEYARLRKLGEVTSFIGYLHAGAVVRWHFDEQQLTDWLHNHPSLALFDGLDEIVDPRLRDEVSVAIHRFADEYPRARVLVTSRRVEFRHHAWQAEGFRVFVLQELDDTQIADFLARWHRATYEDEVAASSRNARLMAAMQQSSAIRRLASNPLLLTMMAILSRAQELPRGRAQLYEQCVLLLLHRWKAEIATSQDSVLARGSLDYEDKRNLLVRVASVTQAQEGGLAGNLIDEETLEKTLSNGLKGLGNPNPRRAAQELIGQLRGRNFMLSSVGPRVYGFVHRTFLEYFCALDIKDRFENEQVLSLEELKTDFFGRWRDPSMHEVLRLLCGMLAPRFVAEILTWLVHQGAPHSQSAVLLAARCLNEVRKRHEVGEADALVRRYIEQALRADSTQQNVMGVMSLIANVWRSDAGIVPWLRARMQPGEGPHIRAAALRELARGWPDDPQVFPMLIASAQDDSSSGVRATAIMELQQRRGDDSASLKIVKVCAESDKESEARAAAIGALSVRWKDDPRTPIWLKAQLETDQSSSVRQTIMRELARKWHADPSVVATLKERARSDISKDMRRTAIEELARRSHDDAETLDILKERASVDPESSVRWAALREVTRGWSDAPKILEWLEERGVVDDNAMVRSFAIQLIASGWAGDPPTRRWLKVRAQSDPDRTVREAVQGVIKALEAGGRVSVSRR